MAIPTLGKCNSCLAVVAFSSLGLPFVTYLKKISITRAPLVNLLQIIFVGWNDFGLHGSNQIPTPNIDALGYNGVILDKFYTQQTCTPSRAALLTGKYPMRLGLQGTPLDAGENRSVPFDSATMAERLKELGYSTHLVGKWHLGAACKENTPTMRGFDTHFGYWSGYVGYFSYEINVTSPVSSLSNFSGFDLHNGMNPEWAFQGQYATELFTKKSLEVIDRHNTSKPLFLMLSHLAGHTGHDGIELGLPNKTRTDEIYSYIKDGGRRAFAGGSLRTYFAIKPGSYGFYGLLSLQDDYSIEYNHSYNALDIEIAIQLKFTLFEGGVRGTGVIYSPLFEKKNYVNNELIHISDFLPTFYRAAGGNVEDLGEIDGIDQWDTISKNHATKRSTILLNIDDENGYSGILGYNGRYKLLNGSFQEGIYNDFYGESGRGSENPPYYTDAILKSPVNIAIKQLKGAKPLDPTEFLEIRKKVTLDSCRPKSKAKLLVCNDLCLFDVYSDPCELENLAKNKEKQNVLKELKSGLDQYISEMVPAANKPVDVNSDPKKFNNTWTPWLTCNKHQEISVNAIL